jgi:hypothetical protein
MELGERPFYEIVPGVQEELTTEAQRTQRKFT